MGVVHYRYKSGVQTFSVQVPGAFASVAELKRLIAATRRHGSGRTRGRGPRDGIALCDPRTGEEYVDGNTMIPQNSMVLVHRVAGHSTDAIIASPIVLENDGMASNMPVVHSTLKSNAFTETDDEEMAAIRTVIDAAEVKWGGSPSGGGHDGGGVQHRHGRPLGGETPLPGYVCGLCHIPGHFIQHCPSRSKPPPSGYICHKCGVPGHYIHNCPNYGDRKNDSRRTSSLTPIVPSFDDGIPIELVQARPSNVGDSLPAELHCPLCKKVMTDAMLTSKCCYDSFCAKCIRDYITAQSKCICGAGILADDLIPNQTLRSTISSMLSSKVGGLSSGTGNLTSSNSSNLDGKSISFTASAVLKGDNKQHMDTMPSVATEGSFLITACKNPVDQHGKLTRSNPQSKTEETEKALVKKTIAVADAKTSPEPRCQKQLPPDGVAIVSGMLDRKVVKTKSAKKQRKAGTTGKGGTNCVEYDCNIPFEPSCYNSSFGLGGLPWGADPYSMYFMPNMCSGGYPMGLYNINGISNFLLQAPGMQGYPASHYSSGFQPRVYQDREASAHGRQSKKDKGSGPQSHKPERYHSNASIQKGGSRSGARYVPEMRESSIESHDYYQKYHSRTKAGTHTASSPRDGDSFESHDYDEEFHGSRRKPRARSRSRKSSSRHSYRRHTYEGSTSSDEESNFKRRW